MEITHACGLEGTPRHALTLVRGTDEVDLAPLSPPIVKARSTDKGDVREYSADHRQLPSPARRFRLEVVAVSECGGVLELLLDVEAEA